MPYVIRAVMTASLAVALACDRGTGPGAGPVVAQVTVSVQLSTLGIGETGRADAIVRDAAGNVLAGKTVAWRSSSPAIASVTADGLVTGMSAGSAAIIATSDATSGSANVVVVNSMPNARVENAYVMQVIQNPGGSIPLVAGGNPVLVRVFGRTDRFFPAASPVPIVRIEVFRDSTRVAVDERPMTGSLSTSTQAIHEVVMPASLVQPGLRFRVALNPDSLVAEQSLADNTFPGGAETRSVVVRMLQPLRLHFVPIIMSPFVDGAITTDDLPTVLGPVRQVHPVGAIEPTIGAPMATTWRAELGDRGALSHVLAQVDVARLLEGSTAYYVAVMGAGSGFSGIGFAPNDPTSFGPGTHVSGIRSVQNAPLAHELGHNMGRLHAPCANPADDLDVNYPNAGGVTNIAGADLYTASLDASFPVEKPQTLFDLMSYCGPRWISAYTFNAMLDWRTTEDSALAAFRHVAPRSSLIVWGSIDNGEIRLEPSFVANVIPALPRGPGAYVITAADEQGESLFSFSFDPARVDHASERPFLFAIPMSNADVSRLGHLSVAGEGKQRIRARSPAAVALQSSNSPGDVVSVVRVAGGRALLTWDIATTPLVIAREAGTGRVLGIGTSGRLTVASVDQLNIVLTDGLLSTTTFARVK